jgi:signal transduction histidine kinase
MPPAAPPLARLGMATAGVALLGLAGHVARSRDRPAATTFSVFLAVLGLSGLTTAATASMPALNKYAWLLAYLLIPTSLALFSADYYGLDYVGSRGRLTAFLAPIVLALVGGVIVILGTAEFAVQMAPPLGVLAGLPDVVYWLANVGEELGLYYAGGVMLVATGLVLSTIGRYEHLDTTLGVSLAAIGVWPWLVYLLQPAVSPPLSLATILWAFVVCFWASAAIAALALWHFDLFAAAPAAGNLGPDAALDAMDEAVVVVDPTERVLRVNEAACRAFDVSPASVVGGPLSAVLGAGLDDVRTAGAFELRTPEGTREFESTVSPMTDGRGSRRGEAVVLRDVTERRTREQRLAVLNRVLRHNLRNDMTRIIGRAELIPRDDADLEDLAGGILETADDLVSLGERAREVEEMMALPRRLDATTDLRRLVDAVVSDVAADHPAVAIQTDVPDEATVAGQEAILEVVIRNLVENACAHNDAEDPRVRVSVTAFVPEADAETLAIAVEDNGPGIPSDELDVLAAGREDPLQHGSGLGLWAVQWGVRRLGGDLEFAPNEPRGAVVTVSVPAAVDGDTPTAAAPDEAPTGSAEASLRAQTD